ncbi:MAG TPA: response regulator [Tepidisphaeraceae bacterium]|nr:response regulator [Tepidisphaeraceae bacterium]
MGRILIVDDNLDAARALLRLVQRLGHDVDCAADGASALESIRSHRPDLVILDVMMPTMDGLDVLARIKGDEATAVVTVVMFSATRDAETIRLARRRGAADFWLKGSFDFSELGPRIAALLASCPAWIAPPATDGPNDISA